MVWNYFKQKIKAVKLLTVRVFLEEKLKSENLSLCSTLYSKYLVEFLVNFEKLRKLKQQLLQKS